MNVILLSLKDMVCFITSIIFIQLYSYFIILDTTSAALGWTFYLISTHPDVEEKVIQEINEVLGDKPYPEYDDMAKLKYLGLCIKEGLRLYPSVPTIARYMIEDTEVNGKIIPKGVSNKIGYIDIIFVDKIVINFYLFIE